MVLANDLYKEMKGTQFLPILFSYQDMVDNVKQTMSDHPNLNWHIDRNAKLSERLRDIIVC